MIKWIDCRTRMPEVNDKVLICQNDKKEYLVGIYRGNAKFHYADCCQGIQKTCSASHWMLFAESPNTTGNNQNAMLNYQTIRKHVCSGPPQPVPVTATCIVTMY